MNVVQHSRDVVRWYRRWGTLPVRNWILAAEAFKAQEFKLAAKHYRFGLSAHPEHPAAESARFDLAYCLYRTDSFIEALEELDELFESDCSLKEAYLLRARLQMFLGRALSAADTLKRCIELFPEDIQALSCYAHTSLCAKVSIEQLGGLKDQLYVEKNRLSLEDERNVHLDTAIAHYEIRYGDLRKGERLLARVLATGGSPFEAVLLRGERLLEQSRILPAREQLTRAMTISKKDPRPVMMLAKSYLRTGIQLNPSYALQLAQAACRLSQWENAECLSVLVRAYEANDQQSNAQIFAERIKNLPSTDELELGFFQSSLEQLRAQKVSNS